MTSYGNDLWPVIAAVNVRLFVCFPSLFGVNLLQAIYFVPQGYKGELIKFIGRSTELGSGNKLPLFIVKQVCLSAI